MPVEEAVLDYHVIEETEVEDRPMAPAARRGPEGDGRRARLGGDGGQARADGARPRPVRDGARRRLHGRRDGPRGRRRRGARGRGRARHQHRRPFLGRDPFVRILRPAVATSPRRSPPGSPWRTRSPSGSSAASVEESAATPEQAHEIAMSARPSSSTRSGRRSSSTRRNRRAPDRPAAGRRRRIQARGFIEIVRQRIPVTVEPGGCSAGTAPTSAVAGRAERGGAGPRDRGRARDPGGGLVSQVNLLPPDILAAQRQRRLAGVVALAGVGVIG